VAPPNHLYNKEDAVDPSNSPILSSENPNKSPFFQFYENRTPKFPHNKLKRKYKREKNQFLFLIGT